MGIWCVHESLRPLGAVDIVELFQHDLDFLAIGSAHRNEMKTLSVSFVSRVGSALSCRLGANRGTFAFLTSAGVASS